MQKYAALALALAACAGDKTDTTDSSATDTQTTVAPPADFFAFLEALIGIQCEKLFECVGETTLATGYGFDSVEACVDYLIGTTPTTTTTTYTIADYCPTYDADAAQACLDSLAALECSDAFPTVTTPTTYTTGYITPECNLVSICGVTDN